MTKEQEIELISEIITGYAGKVTDVMTLNRRDAKYIEGYIDSINQSNEDFKDALQDPRLDESDLAFIRTYVGKFFQFDGRSIVNHEQFIGSDVVLNLLEPSTTKATQSSLSASFPPPPPSFASRGRGGSTAASLGGAPAASVTGGGASGVADGVVIEFINEYNTAFQITATAEEVADNENITAAKEAIEHVDGFLGYDQIDGLANRRINFIKEEESLLCRFDDKKAEYVGYAFQTMIPSTGGLSEDERLDKVQDTLRHFYLEQEQFIASKIATRELTPRDVDIEKFYDNLESVLNIAHPKINLVDFLVGIGNQKSELECFGPLLHNAVLDTSCPVGDHYLNGDNLGKVIDYYCSKDAKNELNTVFEHPNFKSLVQNSTSQRAVFQALKSSITSGKLTKLLGDDCREIIKKATGDLPPKDQNKLLTQIDRSQSRLPEATAVPAWGSQSVKQVPEADSRPVEDDFLKADDIKKSSKASDEKAPLSKTTQNSRLATVAATIVGVIVCVALAAAAPAALGIAIASTVGVFCAGSTITYNSYKDDQLEHKNAELKNVKSELKSAYQDRGQHPADLRKGPPYAERENGRNVDRSNERGGRG